MPPAIVPRAGVGDLTKMLLPHLGFLSASDKGKNRARNNRNIRAANNFKKAQRVGDLLVAPLIAGHNCNAQNLYLWRLNHYEERLQVAASRAGAVLIDDHFPSWLCTGRHECA